MISRQRTEEDEEAREEGSGEVSKEFLYTPQPGALESHGEKVLAWHKRMMAEYAASYRRVHNVLYKWLRDAGIQKAEMVKYGVEPPPMLHYSPSLTIEAYSRLLDHGRVIKRRSDGALFILGEPYTSLADLENDPHVRAWRSLGSAVICSADSGWFPDNTVMLLIGEPKTGVKKPSKKGGAAK
jgi:hypothetical protein